MEFLPHNGTEDPHNQYSEDKKDNNLSHLNQQQKFAKYELIKSITISNLQHLMTQASIQKVIWQLFILNFYRFHYNSDNRES